MLVIELARIPPDGLDLDESLEARALHLNEEDELVLESGRLRCHVEIVDGRTVHVEGRLAGALSVECGRCLERYPVSVDQRLDLFFLPRLVDRPEEQEEEIALGDHDVVVGYYDEEKVDLGEMAREQLVLALPLKRLCREDCSGICPSCGRNRNAEPCTCPPPEEPIDPRLEALRKLVGPDRQ